MERRGRRASPWFVSWRSAMPEEDADAGGALTPPTRQVAPAGGRLVPSPRMRGDGYSSRVDLTVDNSCDAEKGFSKKRCTPRLTASMALSFEA
jgi:hypothetical protein